MADVIESSQDKQRNRAHDHGSECTFEKNGGGEGQTSEELRYCTNISVRFLHRLVKYQPS
jgi:hypothetical protein